MTSIAVIEPAAIASSKAGAAVRTAHRREMQMRKTYAAPHARRGAVDGAFGGQLRRDAADDSGTRPARVRESTRSRIGVDQLLMFGAEPHQHVDEDSDLGRQMMPMRIDRVHGKLNRPILRQQPYQPAGIKIAVHQKAWSQANSNPFQRRAAQRLATVGNEVTCHTYGRRCTLAINEAPLVTVGIVDVAEAVALAEPGEFLHPPVSLDVTLRAAQDVTPGRQAADDQAGIRWRYQPDCEVESFIDHVDAGFAHQQFDLDVGISREELGDHGR